ncbi:anthocyanidin 3-O-glucosyltransferase 5-like [Eucalyptus grandis]|uniref:anthocyanidin 3-O-glucosyltransferase 5-like n=1 Tax=Eucalyptus grandis TaxID=71139 RepID=UPI00192EE912|nr:anthocyanidin 3-O-glucosyltransferase 5-like [Eucalyptus grandis]
MHSPTLDEQVKGEYVDRTRPLEIPGSKPVQPEDVVDPMLDRSDQSYHEHVRLAEEIPKGDGILLNAWEHLQAETLAALRNEDFLGWVADGPVYTVGPLIRPVRPAGLGKELLEWLDKQPSESGMFVSFGSGRILSTEQPVKLAWGLELSQQRFIWVFQKPTIESFDGLQSDAGKARIADKPLYYEQRLNATLLTEVIGAAVWPKELPSKKIVGREEIAKLVRTIMVEKEGHGIRVKSKKT